MKYMIWKANIIQLLIVVIIFPILCWPIKFLLAGSNPYNLLMAFQEIEYFQYIAEIIQDAQQGISQSQSLSETAIQILDKLIIISIKESAIEGLCVFLCFNVWRIIPVVKGIWPIIPVAFSTFMGCVCLAASEKGTSIDIIIFSLTIVNIGFIIFRNRKNFTNFAWMIIQGIFSLMFNCLISTTISVVFCTAAMMWTKKISVFFSVIFMIFMSLIAVILIAFENALSKDFKETNELWGT